MSEKFGNSVEKMENPIDAYTAEIVSFMERDKSQDFKCEPDENYGTQTTIHTDGKVTYVTPDYTDKFTLEEIAGKKLSELSGTQLYVRNLVKIATTAETLIPAIPHGNLERFGGKDGLVKALLITEQAKSYLEVE